MGQHAVWMISRILEGVPKRVQKLRVCKAVDSFLLFVLRGNWLILFLERDTKAKWVVCSTIVEALVPGQQLSMNPTQFAAGFAVVEHVPI